MTIAFNILALVAVGATGVMDWYGVEHSFFWIYPHWDVPTHILAGLTIGFWAAAVSSRYKLPPRRAAFFIIGLAFAVGVAWELWEAIEGVGGGYGGYWFDTVKDLCDDAAGGFVALVLYVMMRGHTR